MGLVIDPLIVEEESSRARETPREPRKASAWWWVPWRETDDEELEPAVKT